MKVIARRRSGYTHDVEVAGHSLVIDEPAERGGGDQGATPLQVLAASLAACTAITVEMYADRKGWDLDELAVSVACEDDDAARERSYEVTLHLPGGLTADQTQRIKTIAGKCPVHRALAGETEVSITDRVELIGEA